MEVSFQIDGLDRIERATDRVRQEIARELAKAMSVSAKRVEGEAKKSIQAGGKTGRLYKRGSAFHRASAPGEAPASDTGRLVNSVVGTVDRTALRSGVLEGVIRAGSGIVRYARMLEFGTARMAARPFLFPAFERSRAWIQERLNKAVRTAIIRAVRK